MERLVLSLAIVPIWLGSTIASADAPPGDPRRDRPTAAQLGLQPRGEYIQVEVPVEAWRPGQPLRAEGGETVLYLNRNGGAFEAAWSDDSTTNMSTVLDWSVDLPAYPYGDASWNQVVDCVRRMYAPFAVEVTDVEPDGAHVEVVVSGHPRDIGMQDGVGGVAPMACQPIRNAVTYAFPETYGNDPNGICEAAAQESAHAFGLDHEMLCNDVMTYLYCGEKGFVDEDAACGEFNDRPCACGGNAQNSYQYLLALLGPADPNEPPAVTIVSPEAGDEVGGGFTVEATATDDGSIEHLELWIDGAFQVSREAEPWTFHAPEGLEEGAHVIEIMAFDDAGDSTTADVTVELSEGHGGRSRRGCSVSGIDPAGAGLSIAPVGLALLWLGRRRRG